MDELETLQSRFVITSAVLDRLERTLGRSNGTLKVDSESLTGVLSASSWREFFGRAREEFGSVARLQEALELMKRSRRAGENSVEIELCVRYLDEAQFTPGHGDLKMTARTLRFQIDLGELIRNAELGLTKYRVADSNFTDGPARHKRYPHDVCQLMIDLDLGLQWSCYARVDDLSDELADLMRRAGCFGVFFGIESGSKQILKNMRKGHNVDDAHEGVAIAKRNGLRAHASFIVGYPGETEETYRATLEFIDTARPHTVNLGQFRVEHDTPVYGVESFGLEGQGMQWKHNTMDWQRADELVLEGNKWLLSRGVCLGTECSFPTFIGLGLSLDESQQMMSDMDLVGRLEHQGQPPYQQARDRLRTTLLERFPKAIAKDQNAWAGSAL